MERREQEIRDAQKQFEMLSEMLNDAAYDSATGTIGYLLQLLDTERAENAKLWRHNTKLLRVVEAASLINTRACPICGFFTDRNPKHDSDYICYKIDQALAQLSEAVRNE